MTDREGWYESVKLDTDMLPDTPFDAHGNYRHRSNPEPYVEPVTTDDSDADDNSRNGPHEVEDDYSTSTDDDHGDFRTCFAICSQLNVAYIPPIADMVSFEIDANTTAPDTSTDN